MEHDTGSLAPEAQYGEVLVGLTHPPRGDDAPAPALREQPTAPVHELTRGEVTEPGQHVVDLDLGHAVTGVPGEHDAHRLARSQHEDGHRTGRGAIPRRLGVET